MADVQGVVKSDDNPNTNAGVLTPPTSPPPPAADVVARPISAVRAAQQAARALPTHSRFVPEHTTRPPSAAPPPVAVPSGATQPTASPQAQPVRPLFGVWLNRPRRVLLALTAIWIVAIFDLGFTLLESESFTFVELNPLAAAVVGGPDEAVFAFKFGLLSAGSVILLALRRHATTELACWFLLTSKVYLAIRWYVYYSCLVHGYMNPLLSAADAY